MIKYPSSDGGSCRINHNRKCRDVVFLVIFVAFWVSMIVNSSFGFNRGNPLRLIYGLDYRGNICGDRHADPNLHKLELRYWLKPNEVYQSGLKNGDVKLPNARSICLDTCPIPSEDSLNWVCDYPEGDIHVSTKDWIRRNYDYFVDLPPDLRNSSLQLLGPCYPVIFPSINVYWSCQFISRPSNVSLKHWKEMGGANIFVDGDMDKSIHNFINSRSSVFKRYVADVEKSWPVLIVCGGILPVLLSVIWLLMTRYLVTAMPWITVVLFNGLIISVTMFYYLKAGWIGNNAISPIIGEHDPYYNVPARELSHLYAITIFMTIIMVIAFLSSIAIVPRILMGTSVLKLAARVIGEVQELIVFPIIPFAILGIFYILWFSAAFYLFSSGHVVQNDCSNNCCSYDLKAKQVKCNQCCGFSVQYTPHIAAAILFHLFGGYWATQFVVACSSTIIAGSVASYYWGQVDVLPAVPFFSVVSSMKRLARYHIGSVALGSLVVSFTESTRSILEALRRKFKSTHHSMSESWADKMAFNTSQGCSKSISWIIKSLNHNAYIMIAIRGESFFKASESATELIFSNILRIGKVNVIGDAILKLGKLCISLACALFAFLMLDTHKYNSANNKISSPLFPVLVCWGLGYIVATLFFLVVQMSVDTIILFSCEESEHNQAAAPTPTRLLNEVLSDDHSET